VFHSFDNCSDNQRIGYTLKPLSSLTSLTSLFVMKRNRDASTTLSRNKQPIDNNNNPEMSEAINHYKIVLLGEGE
jgi:hypothetical protein